MNAELKLSKTERGFTKAEFDDIYGSKCSLQESSLATTAAIWLGVDVNQKGQKCTRMHLTQDQVAALLPHLECFVRTGELEISKQKASVPA